MFVFHLVWTVGWLRLSGAASKISSCINEKLWNNSTERAEFKANLGKQIGGDIIANKKTFLILKAFELANDNQKQTLQNLALEKDTTKKVNATLQLFNALNIKLYCEQEADRHTQEAISCLEKINVSEEKKNNLKQFALELLNRII